MLTDAGAARAAWITVRDLVGGLLLGLGAGIAVDSLGTLLPPLLRRGLAAVAAVVMVVPST